MKKFTLMFLCLVCMQSFTFAQKYGKVTGKLYDQAASQQVAGAMIEFSPENYPDSKKYVSTGADGKFSAEMAYGSYNFKITFLGLDDIDTLVTLKTPTLDLGQFMMKPKSTQIDDVVLEVQALRTSINGDTLIYNADAFKVSLDSDVDGLLAKMPGIRLTDDGVEAQGETIEKIFVDGKEFFGSDVTTAIKTLPAEIVDKVEILNKLSDQSEFSGIDDGNSYKAMNIVTKKNMRTGQFGKFSGEYGIKDKYLVGGSLNLFNSTSRITLLGLTNNLNQQNFSTDDILGATGGNSGGMRSSGGMMRGSSGGSMVGQQSGISTITSAGVNYTDSWGKKITVEASYFYNATETENTKITDRDYFSTDDDSYKNYYGETTTWSKNQNHRLNAKIEYKINENNEIMFRPSLSFQDYESTSSSWGINRTVSGADSTVLNNTNSHSSGDNFGYNMSGTLVYRTKFAKLGRTLTFTFTGNMSKNDKTSDSYSQTEYPSNSDNNTEQQQYILNNTNTYTVSGNVIYAEPLSLSSQLTFNYKVNYKKSDTEKLSYEDEEYTSLDEDLSNVYKSGYLTQTVGPGFRRYKNNLMLVANLNYQFSTLESERTYPVIASGGNINQDFNDFMYFGMVNYTINPANSLRVMLRSSTDTPSVTELQDYIDTSSPLNVSTGNPYLKPSYTHSLMVRYLRSNAVKGRSFMASINASLENNYIADSTVYIGSDGATIDGVEIQPDAQFTKPINMDGKMSLSGTLNYGTPLNFISSNLNLNASYRYNVAPTMVDGVTGETIGNYWSYGAVLGSNISPSVDFTLSYTGGYNVVSNSLSSADNSTYLTQSATGKLLVTLAGSITITANASYYGYSGISSDFNEEYVILSAYIGKKFLKNKRLEFSAGVYDILDQNTSFSRNVSDTYIENVTNDALGRYVSFKLTYTLRNFPGGDYGPQNGMERPERREGGPMGEGGGTGRGPGGGGGGGMMPSGRF